MGRKVAVHELTWDEAWQLARRLSRKGATTGAKGCTCFPAGMGVLLANGHLQAIQTLHVGQLVQAEDPATRRVVIDPGQAVIADAVRPLLAIDLSNGSVITVPTDYPSCVDAGAWRTQAGWLPAGQLRVGDHLRIVESTDALVVSLHYTVGQAVVYTLTVAKDHTLMAAPNIDEGR